MAKRTLCDAYKTACIDYLHSSASLFWDALLALSSILKRANLNASRNWVHKFIVWMNNYPEGKSISFETELLSVWLQSFRRIALELKSRTLSKSSWLFVISRCERRYSFFFPFFLGFDLCTHLNHMQYGNYMLISNLLSRSGESWPFRSHSSPPVCRVFSFTSSSNLREMFGNRNLRTRKRCFSISSVNNERWNVWGEA